MAQRMRRWMCAIIAVLMLISMAPTALAGGYKAYFNTGTKVYQAAKTSSRSVGVKKGLKVTITAIKNDWAQVVCGRAVGYCPVKYLNLTNRIKGYMNRNGKIYASASKSSKSAKLTVNTELYIIGRSGGFWRVQNKKGSVTGYVPMSHVSGSKVKAPAPTPAPTQKPQNQGSWKDKVVMMDWFKGGSSVVARGGYATIYDIQSGMTIRVKRMGGTNHADMEPLTKEDTEKLYKMGGNEFSWDSRPVILISGNTYVACAINTMPHGDQTITDNGYEGQFCLHMVSSRTHGSDSENEEHQKAIKKAYNWAH